MWGYLVQCARPMTFFLSINQPLHPRLVPLDLNLDLIRLIELLVHAVSFCADIVLGSDKIA